MGTADVLVNYFDLIAPIVQQGFWIWENGVDSVANGVVIDGKISGFVRIK